MGRQHGTFVVMKSSCLGMSKGMSAAVRGVGYSVCDLLVDGVRVSECCVETTATNAEEFTVVRVVVAVCGSTS